MKAAQVGPISAARCWHHAGLWSRKWTLSGGRCSRRVRRWPGRALRWLATRTCAWNSWTSVAVPRTQSRWPTKRKGAE
jgi:hypothetical protein